MGNYYYLDYCCKKKLVDNQQFETILDLACK